MRVEQMPRFLVFGYDSYYPTGGWGDFLFSAKTEQDARSRIREYGRHFDHWEIVDLETENYTPVDSDGT